MVSNSLCLRGSPVDFYYGCHPLRFSRAHHHYHFGYLPWEQKDRIR